MICSSKVRNFALVKINEEEVRQTIKLEPQNDSDKKIQVEEMQNEKQEKEMKNKKIEIKKEKIKNKKTKVKK